MEPSARDRASGIEAGPNGILTVRGCDGQTCGGNLVMVQVPCTQFVILSEAKELCNLPSAQPLPASCMGPSFRKRRGPQDDKTEAVWLLCPSWFKLFLLTLNQILHRGAEKVYASRCAAR